MTGIRGPHQARLTVVVATALLLAGCSVPPPRPLAESSLPPPQPPQAARPPAEPAARPAPPKPAVAQKKAGGYYLDDGPGDNPPDNLDSIPDAEPKAEPLHRFANNPYSVFGQDYAPAKEVRPYRKRGIASWYGRRFHGQPTSSGERYDMYGMTAAHPTLPIPSYARVTNLASGKSVVVRINDRGPFHANRIIDLSYTAAYKLGYAERGSTAVEVASIIVQDDPLLAAAPPQDREAWKRQPVALAARPAQDAPAALINPLEADDPIAAFASMPDPASPPPTVPTVRERGGVFLQLAAFSGSDNAESFRAHLMRELPWLADKATVSARNGRYRLRVGPYGSTREAKLEAARIRSALDIRPFVAPE